MLFQQPSQALQCAAALVLSSVLFLACSSQRELPRGDDKTDSGMTGGDPNRPSGPMCGNGRLDEGEQCDGDCPTTCAARGCTLLTLEGAASSCSARCSVSGVVTTCTSGDGCCPSGCDTSNDDDCSVACGDGVKQGNETCDPLSTCPTSCSPVGCQLRKLVNDGTCTAECINDKLQTTCKGGDGCCPPGCTTADDGDCSSRCGDGVVQPGETCDPVSDCSSRAAACVSDKDFVRSTSGDASLCTVACTEVRRLCGTADGQCPSSCMAGQDPDCKLNAGAACRNNNECSSGACIDGACCTQACAACQECKGPGGTCRDIGEGQLDPYPAGACSDGFACNGKGKCLKKIDQRCQEHSECLTGYCGILMAVDGYPRGCQECGKSGQQCCPTGTRCPDGHTCDQDHAGHPHYKFFTFCSPCTGTLNCCTGTQCVNGSNTCHTCDFP